MLGSRTSAGGRLGRRVRSRRSVAASASYSALLETYSTPRTVACSRPIRHQSRGCWRYCSSCVASPSPGMRGWSLHLHHHHHQRRRRRRRFCRHSVSLISVDWRCSSREGTVSEDSWSPIRCTCRTDRDRRRPACVAHRHRYVYARLHSDSEARRRRSWTCRWRKTFPASRTSAGHLRDVIVDHVTPVTSAGHGRPTGNRRWPTVACRYQDDSDDEWTRPDSTAACCIVPRAAHRHI